MNYKQPSGKKLYLILWGGAAFIGIIMVGISYKEQLDEKQLLKNKFFITKTLSGESINDLLLSADELTIAEKKSFISLYLKPGSDQDAITYQKADNKRDEVYKLILQRKMNKLNRRPSDDFSVKPVPK